jgi:GNAT superfamily N-acetyltransferase
MNEAVVIRPMEVADETVWRTLWSGYLDFYESTLPQSTTDFTWQRIIGDDPAFGALVAERDGTVIGFANYVLHPITWAELPVCLLHDLFVLPEARGAGAGRKLIAALIDLARSQRWARVYWVTKESNTTARMLYDSFAPADGFIRYTVKVPQ